MAKRLGASPNRPVWSGAAVQASKEGRSREATTRCSKGFQARACNTLAFGAVARSAEHRHRARRPAPWPRARTGAHTATMPWRSGRAAAKGVPLPPPQRRWPASVARRPREGPSLRRAAHLRTASGAAGVHGKTLQHSIVPDAILDRATQTWITRIRDSSRFAHSFFLLGALLLADMNEWMEIV